jgi:hypothetical protein
MGGYGARPYLKSIGARWVMHGYVHKGRRLVFEVRWVDQLFESGVPSRVRAAVST